MRKIIFFASVGGVGMDGVDNGSYPDDVSDQTLNQDAWDYAISNAEMYGIYPVDCGPDDSYDSDDEFDDADYYSDSIDGYWEDYDPEKHDMLSCNGRWEWRE